MSFEYLILAPIVEATFQEPKSDIGKVEDIFLTLLVIIIISVPVHFGLKSIYSFLWILVYVIVAAIILKLTVCIKLETDGAKTVAKAIESVGLKARAIRLT